MMTTLLLIPKSNFIPTAMTIAMVRLFMCNVTASQYLFIAAHSERVICVLGKLLELAGKKCRRPNCLSVCSI